MSDFISTSQDAVRDVCIATFVQARSLMHTVAERAKENPGQTAAEYMGVLLLIAVIIAAVIGSGMGEEVAKQLKAQVVKIAGLGDCPDGQSC